SASSTPCSARSTDFRRTASRSPSKCLLSLFAPCFVAHAKQTNPTGFAADPPVGPATPVIAADIVPLLRSSAPVASSSAVCSLTAPCCCNVSPRTPSNSCFAAFEYTTNPRSHHSDEPAIAVTACDTHPPVHDSAVTRSAPESRNRPPTRAASASSESWLTARTSSRAQERPAHTRPPVCHLPSRRTHP